MKIEDVFKIIDKNKNSASFCDGVNEKVIEKAEQILGVKFPTSYKRFLLNYGAGDVNGFEFFGIINDPESDASMIPNMVWLTKDLRQSDFPSNYIPVAETGNGEYYVIDTSETDSENENPVLIWNYGGQKLKFANSFADFAYKLLTQ